MSDLSNFNPDSAGEIADRIVGELKGTAITWWKTNSELMQGYVKSLAEAAFQTRVALADKRITEKTADLLMHMQELSFNQTLQFTKLMTLALAQKLVDAAFRVIGWVIFNKTGVNLTPHLVQPTK